MGMVTLVFCIAIWKVSQVSVRFPLKADTSPPTLQVFSAPKGEMEEPKTASLAAEEHEHEDPIFKGSGRNIWQGDT